jgi:hypothetical protein
MLGPQLVTVLVVVTVLLDVNLYLVDVDVVLLLVCVRVATPDVGVTVEVTVKYILEVVVDRIWLSEVVVVVTLQPDWVAERVKVP